MSEQTEQNIAPENLDTNSCAATLWESMKKEVLVAVDEKFDVEAVAQMVEHLEFSQKLNGSLQRSFQGLQAELTRKDQMIQYLQGRLDNLELDVMLLKRTIAAPSPFPNMPIARPQPMPQMPCPQTSSPKLEPVSNSKNQYTNSSDFSPPDFSKLRGMTVAEPVNKFVPPQKSESAGQETESTNPNHELNDGVCTITTTTE